MRTIVYWERYRGDKRPAPKASWVWNDGSKDSYQYVFDYTFVTKKWSDYWFIFAPDVTKESREEIIKHGPFNAMRYYDTGHKTLPQ